MQFLAKKIIGGEGEPTKASKAAASKLVNQWKDVIDKRLTSYPVWMGQRRCALCISVVYLPDICDVHAYIYVLFMCFIITLPCEVCLPRGKRGLFNRSNWTANMYRSMMVDIVFALLDVFAGENNKASMLFAAFMSVYLIL